MYLLEAKKRAEKEYKKQQEKERKDARERARQDVKQQAKQQKEREKAAKKDARKGGGGGGGRAGPSSSSAASEAQRALEEAQVKEALRRSQAEADAKSAARERTRQSELARTRAALADPDYDYEDLAKLGQQEKIGQAVRPKADLQFQAVASHPDGRRDKRNSIHGNEWNDMSISCWYVGTFEVGKANKIDKNEVKRGIHSMKEYIKNQREATLVICLEGMKVVDTTSNKVAMAHALSRVSMAAADSQLPLFGFVAKNPGVPDKFCHVFNMNSRAHAEHLQGLVMQAFKLAFANERQEKGSKQAPKAAPPPAAQARQWAKHNPLPGLSGGDRPQQHRPSGQPAARSITQAAQQAAAQQPQQPQQPKPKAAGGGRNADGSALPQDSSGPIPKAGGSKATSIENAAWFQAGVPREIAMELLEMSEDGAFVVRDSSSQPGNYALTLKGDGLMHHFIIRKVPQGYVLGSEAQGQSPFGDLGSLIVNYASTPGCLPCCLSLDSFNQVYKEQDDVQSEHSFVDPDYQDLVQLMGKR